MPSKKEHGTILMIFYGTIQILRKHWNSGIGHFCLLTVHREWVGGLENAPKHAYVIFQWSLITETQQCNSQLGRNRYIFITQK